MHTDLLLVGADQESRPGKESEAFISGRRNPSSVGSVDLLVRFMVWPSKAHLHRRSSSLRTLCLLRLRPGPHRGILTVVYLDDARDVLPSLRMLLPRGTEGRWRLRILARACATIRRLR